METCAGGNGDDDVLRTANVHRTRQNNTTGTYHCIVIVRRSILVFYSSIHYTPSGTGVVPVVLAAEDEEAKKSKLLGKQDVEMEDEGQGKNSKSHRDLFQKKDKGLRFINSMFLNYSDSESDAEDSDDSVSSHGSAMEMNLLANQNPFGNQYGRNNFGFGGR